MLICTRYDKDNNKHTTKIRAANAGWIIRKIKVAVLYGSDAIYMGTPDMSLRTKSAFTLDEVAEGIEFAHKHGKRVYLTLNLFTHNIIRTYPNCLNIWKL